MPKNCRSGYLYYKYICGKVVHTIVCNSHNVSQMTITELNEYLGKVKENLKYSTECAYLRKKHTEECIKAEDRDEGHEYPIEQAENLAALCKDELVKISHRFNELEGQLNLAKEYIEDIKSTLKSTETPSKTKTKKKKAKQRKEERKDENIDSILSELSINTTLESELVQKTESLINTVETLLNDYKVVHNRKFAVLLCHYLVRMTGRDINMLSDDEIDTYKSTLPILPKDKIVKVIMAVLNTHNIFADEYTAFYLKFRIYGSDVSCVCSGEMSLSTLVRTISKIVESGVKLSSKNVPDFSKNHKEIQDLLEHNEIVDIVISDETINEIKSLLKTSYKVVKNSKAEQEKYIKVLAIKSGIMMKREIFNSEKTFIDAMMLLDYNSIEKALKDLPKIKKN